MCSRGATVTSATSNARAIYQLLLLGSLPSLLAVSLSHQFVLPVDWYTHVVAVLNISKEHVKMCVLKTWIGGWTTSICMHEPFRMNCLFGCRLEKDELLHYLQCSPLWQLSAEALRVSVPLDLRERLCILNPLVERMQLLALCFQGYYYAKANCEGEGTPAFIVQKNSNRMQAIVQEAMRTFKHTSCT